MNIIKVKDRQYETKFKIDDRVIANGYCGVLVLDSVDEMLTELTNKLHWFTVSEDYLNGLAKTNNGESYSDDEIELI